MSDPEETIDRRTFLTKSAALLAGGAAFARTALSYDKILGANDRISVGHIGNGSCSIVVKLRDLRPLQQNAGRI